MAAAKALRQVHDPNWVAKLARYLPEKGTRPGADGWQAPVTEQQLLNERVAWGSRSSSRLACASGRRRAVSGPRRSPRGAGALRGGPYRGLDRCWPGRLLYLARWRRSRSGSRGQVRRSRRLLLPARTGPTAASGRPGPADRGREGADQDLRAHPDAPSGGVPSSEPPGRAASGTTRPSQIYAYTAAGSPGHRQVQARRAGAGQAEGDSMD